jgi:ribokinase
MNVFDSPRERDPGARQLSVVGNLTIDVILRGVAEMPRWGEEVLCRDRTETVAGQAAALAFAARALGVATNVVGGVGDDAAGHRIREELAAAGVGVDAIALAPGGSTQMTIALVRPDGERAFVSDLGTLPGLDVLDAAKATVSQHAPEVVALVGTSNFPLVGPRRVVDLLRTARHTGAITVFDPGWDPLGWPDQTRDVIRTALSETDLFLPNIDEARAITRELELRPIFDSMAKLCPGVTVVKNGALGSYVGFGGEIVNVGAVPAQVDNAVGAGDVYNAGVITGYVNGLDLLESLAFASAASSLYVSRRIDRFPAYEECLERKGSVKITNINI